MDDDIESSVKSFFSADQWNSLSVYEKQNHIKIKQYENYIELRNAGKIMDKLNTVLNRYLYTHPILNVAAAFKFNSICMHIASYNFNVGT